MSFQEGNRARVLAPAYRKVDDVPWRSSQWWREAALMWDGFKAGVWQALFPSKWTRKRWLRSKERKTGKWTQTHGYTHTHAYTHAHTLHTYACTHTRTHNNTYTHRVFDEILVKWSIKHLNLQQSYITFIWLSVFFLSLFVSSHNRKHQCLLVLALGRLSAFRTCTLR